jgi:hypothetical protein
VTASACVTWSVTCFVAVTASPLAVTVIVAEPIFVVDAAVSVRVLVPVSEAKVTALLLHVAVTPVGNPLTARLTIPVYVPFPAMVNTSVPDLP